METKHIFASILTIEFCNGKNALAVQCLKSSMFPFRGGASILVQQYDDIHVGILTSYTDISMSKTNVNMTNQCRSECKGIHFESIKTKKTNYRSTDS